MGEKRTHALRIRYPASGYDYDLSYCGMEFRPNELAGHGTITEITCKNCKRAIRAERRRREAVGQKLTDAARGRW